MPVLRRATSVSTLMYVKEDLIIPHHISFYDLISTKARGKSGPLFHFAVNEAIRTQSDARIEKDESHAGVCVCVCVCVHVLPVPQPSPLHLIMSGFSSMTALEFI